MSFSLVGFGAEQLRPTPQAFQALSLFGASPVPPAPPYGTPNQDLVPVQRSGNPPPAVPVNLTLAAKPVFDAILRVNPTVVSHVNQPIGSGQPFTSSTIDANDPAVARQVQLNTNQNGNPALDVPQGQVSFSLTQQPAYLTSGAEAFAQTIANLKLPVLTQQPAQQPQQPQQLQQPQPVQQPVITSAPSYPPSSTPQYVLPASASSVARIVQTVQQLAVSAVYPAPVFSFSA